MPHEYQNRTVRLCKYARQVSSSPEQWVCDGDGYEGEDGMLEPDQGSTRNAACRVCVALEEARVRFEEAVRMAEEEKATMENEAYLSVKYVSVV